MAPMTASLTLRPLADAGGGGLFYSRFPPFFGDAALSLPHVLCCDARPHTRHPVARVRDYPTDIDGRVSSVRLKRLLALRGGVNPVALAGKCAKSAALFFTKPAIEDDLAKQTWVIEIKRLIRRGFAGLALVKLCSYCLLSKRLDHQSELLAPLSDEAQERRLEGCPFPVIVDVPDDLKKLIVDDFVSFDPRKRILALRGGVNPVTLASGCAKSAVSFFLKPAVDEYFSNLSNLLLRPLNRKLDRLLGITLVGFVGLGPSIRRLSKTIAPLTEEAQERRLEGCPLPVIVEDPGDPKKLVVEVRLPKNLRGLGEKAFYLESPEEELGRKIRLVVAIDGISKAWTLQLPLAKHLDPTIKSKLIWVTSIDGASQCKFRRCRLEVI